MHEVRHNANSKQGGRAPIASFWVKIMTSCINIKRGVYQLRQATVTSQNRRYSKIPMVLYSVFSSLNENIKKRNSADPSCMHDCRNQCTNTKIAMAASGCLGRFAVCPFVTL